MNLRQAFKMAFKSIAGKKMRSFLTMLGIIIGVAAVIIMVSVVQGQNKVWREYINSLATNTINVDASAWNKPVSDELYDYCMRLDDLVLGVTPVGQLYSNVTVKYGAKTLGGETNMWGGYDDWEKIPTIYLGNDQYAMCNEFTVAKGRNLSYLDVKKQNQVCVLGSRTAELLFNYANPVGQEITINGTPFTVIGVYQAKGGEINTYVDNMILMPYTLPAAITGGQSITQYVVKARDKESTTEAITRLNGFLKGLIPQNTGYYNVYSNDTWIDQSNQQDLMASLVLGGIAGISLLVGGIGIMNIMLVTVTERTREIGIRKAIGAERKSIIAQFLIEAAVICAIGGVIGLLIGLVGTLIAGKVILNGMILYPSSTIAIGGFLFSVLLGIGFGMYPAIKASGLQPVAALRAD